MPYLRRPCFLPAIVLLLAFGATLPVLAGIPGMSGIPTLDADMGRNLAVNKPSSCSSIASNWKNSDGNNAAKYANDGFMTGEFGFHTQEEREPWWMVDLGDTAKKIELDTLEIWNRMDSNQERADNLQVLISLDKSSWTNVYDNIAKAGGHVGGLRGGSDSHLVVDVKGKMARYVKVMLKVPAGASKNYKQILHLDEVKVFKKQAIGESSSEW